MTKQATHYYRPSRSSSSMDNTKPCCARPESAHPEFADGKTITVTTKRAIRRLNGQIVSKGTTLIVKRESFEAMHTLTHGRWGTNELGQFAELERATTDTVRVPAYVVKFEGDKHSTSLPVTWLKETK